MSALHLRPSPPPRRSPSLTSLVLAPIARPWARKRQWAVRPCSSDLSFVFHCFVSVLLCLCHLFIFSHSVNSNPSSCGFLVLLCSFFFFLFLSTFIIFLWPLCVCYQQEEDLEAQVSFLQGQINDLEAMSKYCAKMMNNHICEYSSNRWSNLHDHFQHWKHQSAQKLRILNVGLKYVNM